jgi:hypothetical protein
MDATRRPGTPKVCCMSRFCSIRQRHSVEPVIPAVATRRAAPGAISRCRPDGARVLFDGLGSTIEAGRIRDVSLTTRVTQSATLHGVSSISSRQVKCKRDDNPRPASRTVKQYKPLLSSAPANSILNAQEFHYRNSASTDIRKTFARFRRNASKQNQPSVATNVRTLTKNPIDATPAFGSLASLRRSSADRLDTTLRKRK